MGKKVERKIKKISCPNLINQEVLSKNQPYKNVFATQRHKAHSIYRKKMTDSRNTQLAERLRIALAEEQLVDVTETSKILESQSPKQLASRGLAVLNLVIGSLRTGMGGRTVISLELDPAIGGNDKELDLGDVRTGDLVRIALQSSSSTTKKKGVKSTKSKKTSSAESGASTEDKNANKLEGVANVSGNSISVVIDEDNNDTLSSFGDARLWLVKLTNNVTYNRMNFALKKLKEAKSYSRIQEILLGQANASLPVVLSDVTFLDPNMNDPQKDAVKFALSDSEISLIHGPPGTGKTFTLIEIIRQMVSRGERVLVCGPSNVSVDNILERLKHHIKGNKLIRIGHPARLFQGNRMNALDIVSKTGDHGQVIRELREEIDQNLGKISKTRSGRERREIYSDVKVLRKDYRVREKKVLNDIIMEAQVVVSTLHGAGSYSLRNAAQASGRPLFDTIIIDEVSQSLEAQCWIPIMDFPDTKKLVIAGDNMQLPPVVMSKSAKTKDVLEKTLFDRVESLKEGEKVKKLLSIQYRMNENIMQFPSNYFYKSKLVADSSVAHRLLCELPDVERIEETEAPVMWIDTQGDDFPESSLEDNNKFDTSRYNENEAYLVFNYVKKLLEHGVTPESIGIIAPYSAQVSLLSKLIHEQHNAVEIATVDGFQGREKEVIILSLVRSNEKGEVGFLGEERRLNVAMTRPKRQLVVVGDTVTISRGSKFLHEWVKWSEDNSMLEFPDIGEVLEAY